VHHDYLTFLHEHWQYYSTPPIPALRIQAPKINNTSGRKYQKFSDDDDDFRMAVVVDCEFGINKYNESELIRLTAIDFFSKEVLIDSLISPTIKMKHYNTKYSGVRKTDVANARRNRTCFMGRDSARKALLRYLGSDTVLIVHGGSGDLTSLRLIHPLIIDTFVLDNMLFEPAEGGRSLKNLCKKVMGIDIQVGKFGHDSVEDAFACRELALCQIANLPDDFAARLFELDDEDADDVKVESGNHIKCSPVEEDKKAVTVLCGHADALLAFAQMSLS
jgi:DNA polymerase III epsilon subunit-like protein